MTLRHSPRPPTPPEFGSVETRKTSIKCVKILEPNSVQLEADGGYPTKRDEAGIAERGCQVQTNRRND